MFDRLLQGKKVFVTGGSRSLGRALCVACAKHGADVAFNYLSDHEGAVETLALLQSTSATHLMHQASVLDGTAFGKAIAATEKAFGQIDILINNAGVSQPLPFALMDDEDWTHVMDVNAKGVFIASRAVLRGMVRRKRGMVLNIGSLAGSRLIEAPVHYCASKAAVHGLTRAMSKEMARYGIQVNCLAPGLLEEGVGRNLPEHRLHDYLEHVAMGRLGKPAEVAEAACFLVSDLNSYMNGEVLVMDGGL
jgi:3-oxoacyl-[acyl-carrier protein] reductase